MSASKQDSNSSSSRGEKYSYSVAGRVVTTFPVLGDVVMRYIAGCSRCLVYEEALFSYPRLRKGTQCVILRLPICFNINAVGVYFETPPTH
eukprot:479599-Prorocentrum_minimum.AAC.1